MSYDLILQKNGDPLDLQAFSAEVATLYPLVTEEMVFCQDLFGPDLLEIRIQTLRQDRAAYSAYLQYLRDQKIRPKWIDRLFRRVNSVWAQDFIRVSETGEKADVLIVFARTSDGNEFKETFSQLRFLAAKYKLRLFDPQTNRHIDSVC